MKYVARTLEGSLLSALKRGKSILLLGPRQTGKTTVLNRLQSHLYLNLVAPGTRQRYEKDPARLTGEVEALRQSMRGKPLVILDEVQRVPELLDAVQDLIDRRQAQFVLSGSSARKLRRGARINLLPGRVIAMRLDPLTTREWKSPLNDLLYFGSLPEMSRIRDRSAREELLESYVQTYLEQEVRAEALVRKIGVFARFLELAAGESGNIINARAMAQELGVSHTTVSGYYEILEDCLVAERVDPHSTSRTRKKLTRSPKYLMFDLGVRRMAANEGMPAAPDHRGRLFEQWVGLELIRLGRGITPRRRLKFWRDPGGPEVDWVVERGRSMTPIEVKWTETPTRRDGRHVEVFLSEYPTARGGYVVCRTPRPAKISPRVTAIPWQEIESVL